MTETPDLFLAMLTEDRPMDFPRPVQITSRKPALLYFRCRTCTEIVTVPDAFDEEKAECDCQGKGFDYLGKAKPDGTLSRHETRAACDARCTNAMGPNCDCLCAGENHGSGKTVRVEIVQGIPRVRLRDPRAAIERRAEFSREVQAALARLHGRYGQPFADFMAGKWIASFTVKHHMQSDLQALRHAEQLKVHRNRIAALKKI